MTTLADLPKLKSVIEAHDLLAKKSLGQHFLLDEAITDRIARTAGDLDCSIIEVGPGPGGLTRALLKAGAKKVYAIEKDERCLPILADLQRTAEERLDIVNDDALLIDIKALAPEPRKIVANLPYNVGTEMLLRWFDAIYQEPSVLSSLTLMFQKEVAERITAAHGSGDYGRLSIISQWLCECRLDFELPPEAFLPPPKVSSAVVTLVPRAKPLVDVKKTHLEKVMAAAFGQRRKMLRGALKSLGCDTEGLLAKAGIDGTKRAEQLDLMTLCRLAQTYEGMITASG